MSNDGGSVINIALSVSHCTLSFQFNLQQKHTAKVGNILTSSVKSDNM